MRFEAVIWNTTLHVTAVLSGQLSCKGWLLFRSNLGAHHAFGQELLLLF